MEVSLLFEYLQAAVGNRKSLSVSVTDADWYRLFEFCKKQALILHHLSALRTVFSIICILFTPCISISSAKLIPIL